MPNYTYQALTEDGQLKSGRMAAANAAEAVAALEAQGLAVQMIRQLTSADSPAPEKDLAEPLAYAREDEDVVLRNRIDQLVQNRDTLAPALAAFSEEMPAGRPRRELKRLATRLGTGATTDELCRSRELAVTWIPLVSGGASLGSTNFLHDLFIQASRDNAVRTQRTRVLAYPLVVFALAMLVLILLCLIVVPTFSNVYHDFDIELPPMSRVLVGFSDDLRSDPMFIFLITIAFLGVFTGLFHLAVSSGLLGFLFGGLTKGGSRQVTAMASFVRRLAEALRGGLTLPTSLRLSGRASGRGWLNREAQLLAEKIESPDGPPWISKLPPTVLFALRAGPGGAPNLPLLQELAELYAERVHARFDWSSGFVTQFAILFVGLVVGFVVLALFIPLVELVNGLTG